MPFPGHWEGDLLRGSGNSPHRRTLVERYSRFVLLIKVPSRDTAEVVGGIGVNTFVNFPLLCDAR